VWFGVSVWEYGRDHYWWGKSDAQKVLEADPMAATEFEGLTLVHSERPHIEFLQMKAPAAGVSNWFKSDGTDKTFKTLIALAKSHGWQELYGTDVDDEAWVGVKESTRSKMSIVINCGEEVFKGDRQGIGESVAVFVSYY
jgi:hypothetical protein